MEPTTEMMTEAVTSAAGLVAAKLGLTERPLKWEAMSDGEVMMMVTPEGISTGKLDIQYGEMRTYRYELFTLNGVELLEKRYGITETGWEYFPSVTVKVNEETTRFYWCY